MSPQTFLCVCDVWHCVLSFLCCSCVNSLARYVVDVRKIIACVCFVFLTKKNTTRAKERGRQTDRLPWYNNRLAGFVLKPFHSGDGRPQSGSSPMRGLGVMVARRHTWWRPAYVMCITIYNLYLHVPLHTPTAVTAQSHLLLLPYYDVMSRGLLTYGTL